jgi:uncharacterized protein involved in response to NO
VGTHHTSPHGRPAQDDANCGYWACLPFLPLGNAVFHLKVASQGAADHGIRIGIAAIIGLIMLIGGRIVGDCVRLPASREERASPRQ